MIATRIKNHKKRIIIAGLTVLLILCIVLVYKVSSIQELSLPIPTSQCPSRIDWKKIIPGTSTLYDVINILGKPDGIGIDRFRDNKSAWYFEYKITAGKISKYVKNRIFFRADWKVDWIEEIIADSDGTYHAISEIVAELGNTVDTLYLNNNEQPFPKNPYDVLGGPDNVVVWSNCGIAVIALWRAPVELSGNQNQILNLLIRYPDPHELLEVNSPTLYIDDVIMMKFIFQPTSYDGFQTYYRYKIPYGLWSDYLTDTKN
jgi:hypothetical protein